MPSPLVVGDPRITDHQHRNRGRRNPAEPFDRLRNSRSGRLYIVNDPLRFLDYLLLSLRDVLIVAVSECGDAEREAQHDSNAQQAGKPAGCFHTAILRRASTLCNLIFATKIRPNRSLLPKEMFQAQLSKTGFRFVAPGSFGRRQLLINNGGRFPLLLFF